MSDTFQQLAGELDAYTESVLPPLQRTKPATGHDIKRSVWDLMLQIDTMMLSVVGRLRTLDASLENEQRKLTPSAKARMPQAPRVELGDINLRVSYPLRRRRPTWQAMGRRLSRVIEKVKQKEKRARQQWEKKQRYLKQRLADDHQKWWRIPRPTARSRPRSQGNSKRYVPPASTDLGIGPAVNLGVGKQVTPIAKPVSSTAEHLPVAFEPARNEQPIAANKRHRQPRPCCRLARAKCCQRRLTCSAGAPRHGQRGLCWSVAASMFSGNPMVLRLLGTRCSAKRKPNARLWGTQISAWRKGSKSHPARAPGTFFWNRGPPTMYPKKR
ncbi:hypothetical protein DTL42_23425 [Bremerella cremea]|uniref:Uncharacterized protein n=2 Tax=Bremerella cremea TaxID=1031537 RepID=A0A368KLD2_9BACT|nr:hypothetical protein DTL42_23425 [Bremerella cremea]